MTDHKTELEKRNIIRLSNKQAKMVTKSCLQTALIQLLDKKELSDISVSELARRAGVSRTAFYSNYQTVDDVLTELIDQELEELNNSIWEAINREEDFFPPIIQKKENILYDYRCNRLTQKYHSGMVHKRMRRLCRTHLGNMRQVG